MKKIYKYKIPLLDRCEIDLPKDAKILTAQVQQGEIYIWAIVNPNSPVEEQTFRIIPTGYDFVEAGLEYIGTVQDRIFVWHVFLEVKPF